MTTAALLDTHGTVPGHSALQGEDQDTPGRGSELGAWRTADDALVDALVKTLGRVDRLQCQAVQLAAQARRQGAAERAAGLPLQRLVELAAGWTGGDARMVVAAGEALERLPATQVAFSEGRLSWGQVRVIALESRHLDAGGCSVLDRVIVAAARSDGAPSDVLTAVDGCMARLRPDRDRREAARAVEESWISVQPAFDGSVRGAFALDAEAAAPVLEALDAAADRPTRAAGNPGSTDEPEDDPWSEEPAPAAGDEHGGGVDDELDDPVAMGARPPRSRAQQRAEALRRSLPVLPRRGRPAAGAAAADRPARHGSA